MSKPYGDHGAWLNECRGCITGKVLENIRNKLEIPGQPNTYDWDALDGYDGDDKGSLSRDPQMQEKVRRVIIQGFIDPEDFNGVSRRSRRVHKYG